MNRLDHRGQEVVTAGAPLDEADAAMILTHGRGDSARGILGLARLLDRPGLTFLAPNAFRNSWYPHSFLAPLAQNEPGISTGLAALGEVVAHVESAGIASDRIILLGFSQGACLTSEYAARNPRRYGGLAILTGGLIGTGEIVDAVPPHDKRFDYQGDLEGTPAFLGCGDRDPHIPIERFEKTVAVLERLGADVTAKVYPGRPHTVIDDEIAHVRTLVAHVLDGSGSM